MQSKLEHIMITGTPLYSNKDSLLFKSSIDAKLKEVNKESSETIKPTLSDRQKIMKLIADYIKNNKLKLYGGHAQNLSLKIIDPDKQFYTDPDDIHDYDIYTFDPINHGIKICNLIYDMGFKNVIFIEAIHMETYSIRIDQFIFCDLTYVPKIIFNNIPFITVDNFNVCAPQFYIIDFLRIFIDPISSSFRWDKHFDRFNIIQSVYPIEEINKEIDITKIQSDQLDDKHIKVVKKFMNNNSSIMITGINAYNKYIALNKQRMSLLTYIKKIPKVKYDLVSTNYTEDVVKLMELLKLEFPDSEISCKEKYPFFQFKDYSSEIYIDNKIIAHIYDHNNICLPFIRINKYNYGTFHFNLMWFLIEAIYNRVYNKEIEYEYRKLASHILLLRNNYLKIFNISFIDKSPFQDFIIQCSGNVMSPTEIRSKDKNYQGFKYNPHKKRKTEHNKNYQNTSGNYIHNSKNLKINID